MPCASNSDSAIVDWTSTRQRATGASLRRARGGGGRQWYGTGGPGEDDLAGAVDVADPLGTTDIVNLGIPPFYRLSRASVLESQLYISEKSDASETAVSGQRANRWSLSE